MLRISPRGCLGAFTSKCYRKVEEIYEMISPHDHVLHRPDMYIGSVANVNQTAWVFDDERKAMTHKDISYSAGLYKIVDEILVNAADNHAEEPGKCRHISVDIGANGSICIQNDGSGIPVVKHKVSGMWLPVMLFGHLLTSSNYRTTRKHLTGGRFGYGAKLTNILSKEFTVETCDERSGLTCRVRWHNNMRTMDEPVITKNEPNTPGYTKIAFTPDYQFFGIESLTADMYKVLKRRLYDFTGLAPGLQLHWNGEKLLTQNFTEYAHLYPGEASSAHAKSATSEIILRVSTDGFQQVSFVNSVHTNDGGTHVEHVMDVVCEYILEIVQKSFPSLHISLDFIRSNIFLFLNLRIQEPEFDSQNKSALQSPISPEAHFPDLLELARQFVLRTKILQIIRRQLGMVRDPAAVASLPQTLAEKLVDAEKADSDEKEQCTLIIVEGDSAMAFASNGLSIIGRTYYGIFPLKGKIRNAMHVDIGEEYSNSVVRDLLRCLTAVDAKGRAKGLRYGKVLLMTDQDNDGVHIKALLCNLFLKFLPSLMTENRICHFVTPLVKLTLAEKSYEFYSVDELNQFTSEHQSKLNGKQFIKYYKGLGSHNQAEVKCYFSKFESHVRSFNYDEARDWIYFQNAFDHKRSDERKKWILEYKKDSSRADSSLQPGEPLTFQTFFETDYLKAAVELFHRTIPHYIDGLTPLKRKIIHCVLRGKSDSKKVVQLAGYVSHHSAYHHGEANISTCVVHIAQNFVGANNLPLIQGEGNFGTRAEGGDDHAKDRYIFARGDRVLNDIFRPEDDAHLSYKECEGIVAEPEFYCPIIPLHFVNGCDQIGYGWRSHFPKQTPIELIHTMRRILENPEKMEYKLSPSFVGFRGTVEVSDDGASYRTYGKYTRVSSNGIHITELPIGTWTTPYMHILGKLKEKKIVYAYFENHRGGNVDIHVYFYEQVLDMMEKAGYMHTLPKLLGLVGKKENVFPVCSSHESNQVREFASLDDAMQAYVKARLHVYKLRSASVLEVLKKKKSTVEAHVIFLDLLESKKIKLGDSTVHITEQLKANGVEERFIQALMRINISSLNNGSIKREDIVTLDRQIEAHKEKSPTTLWLEDLAGLEAAIKERTCPPVSTMRKKSSPKVTSRGLMNLKTAIQSIGVNDPSDDDPVRDVEITEEESFAV